MLKVPGLCASLFWLTPAAPAQVLTSQYDNARTGANLHETRLTPKNVNANQFGRLFALHVDGDVYAQPLYLPNVQVPGKGTRNVLFVSTEHDTVYAFDADGHVSTPLWERSFLDAKAGIKTVAARDVNCPFIIPEIGITSTPAIDPASNTIYILARTKESRGFFVSDEYVQKLHALDVATGAEKFGGPVTIRASVDGKGAGSSKGKVAFDPLRENPRAALLLASGNVYLTWASSCDVPPYHGWVMAYNAHTLAQTAVFNVSPDAQEGGIWLGDTGPAADDQGNLFVPTGNGTFDAASGGRDFGDSVLKLGPQLALLDWFTPFNQQELNSYDADLGSGGPVLIPDQPGSHRHLLVIAGKGGVLYVLDRDQMGKYRSGSDLHAVDSVPLGNVLAFGASAYWNGHLYLVVTDHGIEDFPLRRGAISHGPVARGSHAFIHPGATPSASANGAKDGIVWVLESRNLRSSDRPAVLHAYHALNVAAELYNSEEAGARDRAGNALHFSIPTVANGRVYVGAKREVDVYGLLTESR
jgi:hypothetical protein